MIIKKPLQYAIIIDKQGDYGVFDTMNDAIESASIAGREYCQFNMSRKEEIIYSLKKELKSNLDKITKMISEETGIESNSDNLITNTVILNKPLDTKNFEYMSDDNSISEDSEVIVNGVIVSLEDPIGIIINNSIQSLLCGNSVVFSSHPSIKKSFSYTIQLLNKAIENVGGPKNLVVTVKEPSIEDTNVMLNHDSVSESARINYPSTDKIAL